MSNYDPVVVGFVLLFSSIPVGLILGLLGTGILVPLLTGAVIGFISFGMVSGGFKSAGETIAAPLGGCVMAVFGYGLGHLLF